MLQSQDREFELALLCCRRIWDDGPSLCELAAATTGDDKFDWVNFLNVLRSHKIEGLANQTLGALIPDAPQMVLDQLSLRGRQIALDAVKKSLESLRLQNEMRRAGIPSFIIKGEATGVLAFGRIGLKQSKDIDILVDESHFEVAAGCLEMLGYQMIAPNHELGAAYVEVFLKLEKETVWIHRENKTIVDLHRRLMNPRSLLGSISPSTGTGMSVTLLEDIQIETLPLPKQLVYMSVHGAWTGWARLKWIAEVNGIVNRITRDDLAKTVDVARANGCDRCLSVSLTLCKMLFGTDISSRGWPALEGGKRSRTLVSVAMTAIGAMTAGDLETNRIVSRKILFSQFLLKNSLHYMAEVMRERWTSFEDTTRFPLPARFRFLYPFLRIPIALVRLSKKRSKIGAD